MKRTNLLLVAILFCLVFVSVVQADWMFYDNGGGACANWNLPYFEEYGIGVKFVAPEDGYVDSLRMKFYLGSGPALMRIYGADEYDNPKYDDMRMELLSIDASIGWTTEPCDTSLTYMEKGETFFFFYVQVNEGDSIIKCLLTDLWWTDHEMYYELKNGEFFPSDTLELEGDHTQHAHFINKVGIEEWIDPITAIKPDLNVTCPITNDNINVSFSLTKNTNVDIKLFDINGRVVRRLENGMLTKGRYDKHYNIPELSSGIYFIRLETGEYNLTTKTLKVN